jgi:AraC-like DNA-binding protein
MATSRARLLDLSVALVEDLRRHGDRPGTSPEDLCEHFQVCFPYRGIFIWHVGDDDVVGDANQVVFVRGGESYRVSQPTPAGYAELIVTPEIELLRELAHVNGTPLFQHPLFRRRSLRAAPRLLNARARFLHWALAERQPDVLEAEEAVLALLRRALRSDDGGEVRPGAATARLVRRAKEFLEAELSTPIRLADVGRAAGASPAYLTNVFRRIEGVSLHRYLTQLRLSRALVELPHTTDLTALALDIGFSSHSHFTFAFRRAFGCTPSQFRETARAGRRVPSA